MSHAVVRRALTLFALTTLLAGALDARAQPPRRAPEREALREAEREEPTSLVSDRPTNGVSSQLVPDDHLIFETGFSWESEDLGASEVSLVRSLITSLRLGWRERIEIQINYAGQFEFDRESKVDDAYIEIDGEGDFEIATKIGLLLPDRSPVTAALLLGLNLPTGDDFFGSTSYDPKALLAVGTSLGGGFGVEANVGADWLDGDLIDGVGTFALSYGFASKWAVIAEHTVVTGLETATQPIHSQLYALTFQPTLRWQIDAFVGNDLSDEAPDSFGGLGVVWRTP